MKVVSIIGARPQFVKSAVVSAAFAALGVQEDVVHTGQHYDDAMSGQFLEQLGITLAANLEVGSGSHAVQTARMMERFEAYLLGLPAMPDAVVVYGDTNSTVAAGLVAAKLGIVLVHVEAGLRSRNRAMPEELNRVVVDHLSDMLFCSSHDAVVNLAAEGIARNVHDVGDVMLDGFLTFSPRALALAAPPAVSDRFALATIHRPSNTDDPEQLRAIVKGFGTLGLDVVWPLHPRTRARLGGIEVPANVKCVDPVGYLEMLALLDGCAAVLTDSGGLQKASRCAGRPSGSRPSPAAGTCWPIRRRTI
jgi:UDP-GlcNAc3NAcA epimerase